jgi:hypothetical protein
MRAMESKLIHGVFKISSFVELLACTKREKLIAEKKNNNERSMIGASTSNRSVNTTYN